MEVNICYNFMENLKYFEILKLNSELKDSVNIEPYNISVISNITINQFKEILELPLRRQGINAIVEIGDYDNIVQDSIKYQKSNLIIVFWEVCNLIDGLHFKIDSFNNTQFDQLLEKTKSEIGLVLKNLKDTNLVLFNKFTSESFSSYNIDESRLDLLTNSLNEYLLNVSSKNIKIVNLEKSILNIGIEKSIDLRYYYSSKALYTVNLLKKYTDTILPFILSANGKAKKALILDCDNTLWKGVLGEDGIDKIEMSTETKDGQIFSEIQEIALSLNKKGILLCICSKNNFQDVQEVFNSHPKILIKDENITVKKINWVDKATNIQEIANELNIGLDSLVFIDDSSFEINLVKERLPEVTVLQVPKRLSEYPKMLRRNLNLFYNLSQTKEDLIKVKMYKQQNEREGFEKGFVDIKDYLTSLEMNVEITKNNAILIPRISQLTQKTNQFNLTTKRYTESEIESLLKDKNVSIYTFSVSDKFGDNGVTGLCIVNLDIKNGIANIDSFLMSCRIIGRNIEVSFMNYLIEELRSFNILKITASYIKTLKNKQVKSFYNNSKFSVVNEDDSKTNYILDTQEYNSNKIKYINITPNGK
jgi:FkbH-like protein